MQVPARFLQLAGLACALALVTVAAAVSGPLDMVPREGDVACVKPATATARSAPRSQ